jgi:hypothetical protein
VARDLGPHRALIGYPALGGGSVGETLIDSDTDIGAVGEDGIPVDGTNPGAGASSPDLVVTAENAPGTVKTGEATLITWSVRSEGNKNAAGGGWRDDVWFSRDQSLNTGGDLYLGSWWAGPYAPLAPDASYQQSRYITLSEEALGQGFLIVSANQGRGLVESSLGNNNRALAVNVAPGQPMEPEIDLPQADLTPGAATTLTAQQRQALAHRL